MKCRWIFFLFLTLFSGVVLAFCLPRSGKADTLRGAWQLKKNGEEQVLIFMDGYVTHTGYDSDAKKFFQTRGGTYSVSNDRLRVLYEFDTRNPEHTGQSVPYTVSVKNNRLVADLNGTEETWEKIDDGTSGLAGLWKITARKQGGKLEPVHQAGTRKTIKILTATRFQWAAIDPGTKQFMGTGGGTYTFANGRYTENIGFFSRDSSRVGSVLVFDGKLQNGDWHHSGLSSKGDPIYEVWSRKK